MAHVLDISTARDNRDWITVNKTKYFLRVPGDLPIPDQIRIARAQKRYAGLGEDELEDVDDDVIDNLGSDLRASARAVLIGMSDDVFEEISDEACIEIIQAFGEGAANKKTTTKPVARKSKSSRASKGSTAVVPQSGPK